MESPQGAGVPVREIGVRPLASSLRITEEKQRLLKATTDVRRIIECEVERFAVKYANADDIERIRAY